MCWFCLGFVVVSIFLFVVCCSGLVWVFLFGCFFKHLPVRTVFVCFSDICLLLSV